MDPSLLLFATVFLISGMIVCIVRGYREKEKTVYFATLIPFFMFLVIVCGILNQHTLAIIFFASMAVVATALVPGVKKYNERKMKEALARVGLSAPPRLRDFFSSGWLKFVYRWGVRKTLFIVWLLMTSILGGSLFALNLWLKFMSAGYIVSYTVGISTGIAIMAYYALKSALKEQKPSEEIRSVNAEDLYRKLLDLYIPIWGSRLGGTRDLENKIRSCMKQGLNREEAIRKIAAWEFEGIPWET